MAFIVIECDDETARQIELADAYGELLIFTDKWHLTGDGWNPALIHDVKKFDELPEEFQP